MYASAMSESVPRGVFSEMSSEDARPGVRRVSFDSAHSTVTRYEFAPGSSFPPHQHPQEQITLFEAGSGRFSVGEESFDVEAGGWVVVPGGVPHTLVAGPQGATLVCFVTPKRASLDEIRILD